MMMKIFGAALIVSGGYMIGSVWVRQGKRRLESLEEIKRLLDDYFLDLKQYRRSIGESLSGKGGCAENLLSGEYPKTLLLEDRQLLDDFFRDLKVSSFRDSITKTDGVLQRLQVIINKLKEEATSQWKALPLVAGSIGFLIAVLLF